MTPVLPVVLAGAAAALLVTRPSVGRLRLRALAADRSGQLRVPWPLAAGLGALLLLGPVAGLLTALATAVGQRAVTARASAVAEQRQRARALEALALLGADLRAGRHPPEALASASEVAGGGCAQTLASAAAVARLGGDVPAALTAPPSAVPDVMRGLAACWSVCSTTGSGLAAGVERLADGLRAAESQRRAVEAELAGPRATAVLLAALPVAGLALAAALGADPLRVLLHTPAGLACLVGGLLLDGLGLLWTRRLVANAVGG